MLGHSLGALNAVIVAAKNKRVARLITINGFFGFPFLNWPMFKAYILLIIGSVMRAKYRKVVQFFFANLKFNKVKIPTLVISSSDDKVVSPLQSKIFYGKIATQNKAFKEIHKIDHGMSVKGGVEEVAEIISGWLTS